MELTTVWFALIAVLWMGYFALEGFDFGVGMLLPVLAKNDTERRVLINTIGPVWDGNEVWLLVAGGATFAAFPEWYATLFSGFYLPLLLILRRPHRPRPRLRVPRQARRRPVARPLGPRDHRRLARPRPAVGRRVRQHPARRADRRRHGVRRRLLQPAQPVRAARRGHDAAAVPHPRRDVHRPQDRRPDPRSAPARWRCASVLAAAVVAVAFLVWTQVMTGSGGLRGRLRGGCAAALVAGLLAVRAGREGWAFLGTFLAIALGVAGLFLALFPDVMPTSLARRHQPDDHERRRDAVHAEDHDRGRRHLHARSCCLPGLDLLGLPQADRRPPHPGTPSLRRPPAHEARSTPGCARTWRRPAATLAGVLVTGVVGSVLVLAQAWVVTGLVLAALHDGDVAAAGRLGGGRPGARAASWDGPATCSRRRRPSPRSATSLRRRLVAGGRRVTAPRDQPRGEVAALVTRGVAAAEPYLTRYVPALVLAAVLPPLARLAVATQDLLSGVIVLSRCRWSPSSAPSSALATRDRAASSGGPGRRSPGHFVDVVRGLPTLVAHRRARAQSARSPRSPTATATPRWPPSGIAFASSAVLELVATLSVALVAVTVGVRLAAGSLDLGTALVVLLLAPEAYWPLRRVGAEFHAAAEGVATFEAAEVLLANHLADEDEAAAPVGADLVLDQVTRDLRGSHRAGARPVSAVIPAHGVTVVSGPSGCGKSTLLVGDGGPAGAHQRDGARGRGDGGRRRLASARWRGSRNVRCSWPARSPTTCGWRAQRPMTTPCGRPAPGRPGGAGPRPPRRSRLSRR